MVPSLRDSHVLVVGGAGFVGSNLCRTLLSLEPRAVLVVDNLLSSERDNLPEADNLSFVQGSIADDTVFEALPTDFDYIFHLATYHGNQSSIHDPLADHQNNTLTSLKLFHWAKDLPALRKLVYSSAGCTVAAKTEAEPEATIERDEISLYLDSPYQISKIIGELYGNYFHQHDGLPIVKARFQNVYGPGEVLGAGRWRGTPATLWRNVVPTFIYKALHRGALPIHGDGRATRDFIFVEDIVDGLLRCASSGSPGEVYNLASGVETSIANLAEMINATTANPFPPDFTPGREWDHSMRRYGSTEKAHRELGFRASVDLAEGVQRTVDWTRASMSRIDACMDRHSEQLGALSAEA